MCQRADFKSVMLQKHCLTICAILMVERGLLVAVTVVVVVVVGEGTRSAAAWHFCR